MPKLKTEEAGSLSKYERQKLQRLYTQGAAAYGSVRNLAKASRLPVSKVRQFLHSKDSYTKFTLAARKFKRMRAFARFRNEIWCMDLAYVDKLSKENNGVKYLLVRQDLFDRTVNAKGMKTKDSQETVKAFSSMITKRNRPKKIWVDKGTEFAGAFKKFCVAEGIQVYSTMSETKAAFAERTIRSLKNILYRYMEDFGYKYIHKLPQFITTLNSRRNRSIDMRPNTVKNCDFMSILYSKLYENSRNLYSKLVTECESQSMIYLFAKVTSRSLHEKFLQLLELQQENHQHTQSRRSKTRLFKANFIKKS